MRGERGAVLAQVLIMSVVAGLLCAAILRARLQPALTTARLQSRVADDLAASGAVNRVVEVWARKGVCGSDGDAGVACAGLGCRCECVVRPFAESGRSVRVAAAASGRACALSATPL
ncbi:MAG: hypothetical protein HY079_06445 [Elusimicrobia bacterium]|nr:hypothetical protein [Elusimicrobiota bacterium]